MLAGEIGDGDTGLGRGGSERGTGSTIGSELTVPDLTSAVASLSTTESSTAVGRIAGFGLRHRSTVVDKMCGRDGMSPTRDRYRPYWIAVISAPSVSCSNGRRP